MHGITPAGVLLFSAALLAASASAAVGTYGGQADIIHAAPAGSRASARLHTACATLTRRLEDEVAPDLSWAANLLGGDGIGYNSIKHADKPACDPHCAAPGQPYSRGCEKTYGCRQ
uniref:Uncharacterized protein n=1 Tax=Avena sativa TaxID=4498 RepID=A0ACD5Y9F8_AVESA